ncbi:GTPase [Tundrisphaera lichenicola]|uniref:GTPase n=1 Tax=Tundrisphaera lichenicola TaxID=2029860 RepID=UPI003EC06C2F
MLKNWRWWVLIVLFLGPYLGFMGLGFLWLKERGWVWVSVAGGISIVAGVAFTLLMSRWTKSPKAFLPPIDWDAPHTFSEFDRQAWALVEAESERGDSLDMAALTRFETYTETGLRLANRIAAHYNPLSADPIERMAVVELLTALELAAEDLANLCRQIPGGDLVTPADWKRAVVAAGYIQKASDLYTYLLPLFNPVTGLPRLASQHLMVKPAWKSMQQNVLRWFYRAFVNRLGTHLIELDSGRLSIGADQYRRLTRRKRYSGSVDPEATPLVIAVAGARHSGKSKLIEAIEQARQGDPTALGVTGLDQAGLERLETARIVEAEGYTTWPQGKESARARSTRRHAVADSAEADLLILAVDVRAESSEADQAFLRDWAKWYVDHPGLEVPPVLAVATHVDAPGLAGGWMPPHDWTNGQGPREMAVRSRIKALRDSLPSTITEIIPAAPGAGADARVAETVLPPLTRLCHKAERNALIRNLRAASARSRAGRLFRQVGHHGRALLKGIRERGKPEDGDAA